MELHIFQLQLPGNKLCCLLFVSAVFKFIMEKHQVSVSSLAVFIIGKTYQVSVSSLAVFITFARTFACQPPSHDSAAARTLVCLGFVSHQGAFVTFIWATRLTQPMFGIRKWSWEVKAVCVIMTTSPSECWLVYKNMRLAPLAQYT